MEKPNYSTLPYVTQYDDEEKKNDITKQQEDEFFPSDEILEEEILDLNQYFESFFKEENIESLIAVIGLNYVFNNLPEAEKYTFRKLDNKKMKRYSKNLHDFLDNIDNIVMEKYPNFIDRLEDINWYIKTRYNTDFRLGKYDEITKDDPFNMIFVMDNKYYEKLIEPEDGEEYDIKAFDEINRLNNQIIFRNEIRRIVGYHEEWQNFMSYGN